MNKAALALLAALSVLSCDNPEPGPAPVSFLSVEIVEPYDTGLDTWIFATNEAGELLDVKRLEDGIVLATTAKYTKFDLSILRVDYALYLREKVYNLTTYRNFSQNEIVLKYTTTQPPPKSIGQVKVTITGIPRDKIYSTEFAISSSLYGYSYNEGNWTYTNNSFSVVKMLAKKSDKVVITSVRSDIPVYQIFENVTDGSALTVNFADMAPQPELFTVNAPYGTIQCEGLADNDRSIFHLLYVDGNSTKPLRMSTVPGFTKYKTTVSTSTGMRSVTYTKKGAALSSYAPPQYVLGVSDTTLANFASTFDLSHDFRHAYWFRMIEFNIGHAQVMSVHVYSDNTTAPTVNFEIPPVILAEHPAISLDNLQFGYTSYYRSLGTYRYPTFLSEKFNSGVKSEYELYEFTAF